MARKLAQLTKIIVRAARLSPQTWFDLVRAGLELAIANRKLESRTAKELLLSQRESAQSDASPVLSERQKRLVSRVSFAVSLMGARAPWRSDCLVQALAAERWLRGKNIATQLHIGVRKQMPHEFEAHTWLKVGDEVVTGGDIAGFVPFIASDVTSLFSSSLD